MKITLPESLYNCKIIISLGDRNGMYISERQEMWDLWKSLHNVLYKKDDELGKGNCILPSTFPLKSYECSSTLENWGSIGDIETTRELIIFEDSILSPIQFEFNSYGYPPMKWCEFMRKKGFMLTLYFLDNDNRRIYKTGNCGKCIYDKKSIIEDLYTMPSINYIEASTKYKIYKRRNGGNFCRRMLVKYRDEIYTREGFCEGLKDLLDIYGVGPCGEGIMLYEKSKIVNELEDIEGKLTTGELNEGDYLDKCNSLKKQYNNIKFASM